MSRKKPEKNIRMAFEAQTIELSCSDIVRLRAVTDALLSSRKFGQILASIREVGVIEPPVVAPMPDKEGSYMLLDGHLRLEALKQLNVERVTCLVSTDDESFTYNKHFNHLSPIQEHKMIRLAIEKGVNREKLARALDIDVDAITRKQNMLEGICDEASDILKDKMLTEAVFPVLRRMKPYRQIEAASLMKDANVYSLSFANAILASTRPEQLADPAKPKRIKGIDEAQMARMEAEMQSLQREYEQVSETYAQNFYKLVSCRTYVANLLKNQKVTRYLSKRHPEMLEQFQRIVKMKALILQGKDIAEPSADAAE